MAIVTSFDPPLPYPSLLICKPQVLLKTTSDNIIIIYSQFVIRQRDMLEAVTTTFVVDCSFYTVGSLLCDVHIVCVWYPCDMYNLRTQGYKYNDMLLYLLVSTRAVIGQFSGPYSPVRPAKI